MTESLKKPKAKPLSSQGTPSAIEINVIVFVVRKRLKSVSIDYIVTFLVKNVVFLQKFVNFIMAKTIDVYQFNPCGLKKFPLRLVQTKHLMTVDKVYYLLRNL